MLVPLWLIITFVVAIFALLFVSLSFHRKVHSIAIEDLVRSLVHTVEYVGPDVLPAVPGWAWYDALARYSPKTLASLLSYKPEESNLVVHARRELALIDEGLETIKGYLEIVRAFAKMNHSGGSASVAIGVISQLLQFKELAPLTDDPDEWFHHTEEDWGEPGGVWQNKRNSSAFSTDGGKTYYRVDDYFTNSLGTIERTMHESVVTGL